MIAFVNTSTVAADDALFPADPVLATPLKVTLQLPLSSLLKLETGIGEGFGGKFILSDGSRLPVVVSPRGKSRLKHCSFPPMWLDFKKKGVGGTILDGQNKLKLVTHCSRKFASREFLATEMLAYRLLNLLTDYSFRVRALEITYIDTDREKQRTHYAFLIEHKKRLAQRLGAELKEVPGIEVQNLQAGYAGLIGLFEFMLGNTDFSLRLGPQGDCCHNAIPLQVAGMLLPIPYDFDATGLVNPPYAAPAPNLRIRRVTQRLYRGYCAHNDLLPELFQQFIDKKSELFAAVNNFADIPGVKRERVSKYLSGFFDVLESRQLQQSKLIKQCR